MTLTWTSELNSYFPKEDVQLLKHTGKMRDDISHIIFEMSSCYQQGEHSGDRVADDMGTLGYSHTVREI